MDFAFNQGCDARLGGQPLSACPFQEYQQRHAWRRGWRHVSRYWGLDARWPVLKLPRIHV